MAQIIPLRPAAAIVVIEDQAPAPVGLTAHTGWPETCFACAVAHRAGCLTVTGEAPDTQ